MNKVSRTTSSVSCVLWLAAGCVLGLAACGGAADSAEGGTTPSDGSNGGWPRELRSSAGSGPALFLGADVTAPAIGYVSRGVVFRVAGAPTGDRIPVRIQGGLKVRGWLPMSRAEAIVQRRGRLRGTPILLGPGNTVQVLGVDGDRLRLGARPVLGGELALGPFVGSYPMRGVAATAPEAGAEAAQGGEIRRLPADVAVTVYDRPDGHELGVVPAAHPWRNVQVMRTRGEWSMVRLGAGPFLVGWVRGALGEAAEEPAITEPGAEAPAPAGQLPRRMLAERGRPLFRVPAGTRVTFLGKVIAIFAEDGYAREMRRYPSGEVDVFAAVNDDVAVRGMVDGNALVHLDEPPASEDEATPEGRAAEPASSAPASGETATPEATPAP